MCGSSVTSFTGSPWPVGRHIPGHPTRYKAFWPSGHSGHSICGVSACSLPDRRATLYLHITVSAAHHQQQHQKIKSRICVRAGSSDSCRVTASVRICVPPAHDTLTATIWLAIPHWVSRISFWYYPPRPRGQGHSRLLPQGERLKGSHSRLPVGFLSHPTLTCRSGMSREKSQFFIKRHMRTPA